MRKLFKTGLILFLIIFFSYFFTRGVYAQDCEKERIEFENNHTETNGKIYEDCLKKHLVGLGAAAKTLSNQIAQFDSQIRLTSFKITQTEEKIALLGGRIDQIEISLTDLANAFNSRVLETYKMVRSGLPFFLLVGSDDLPKAVSNYHYLKRIQSADQDLLTRLQTAQTTYKTEKVDQEELQAELAEEKRNLNNQKSAKANLLSVTKNDEKRYQQLLTEAQAQLAAFRRFVNSQGGATILSGQTKCDGWGCYYNQRDSQWGNIGMGGSSYSMAGYGCLVSSVSMLASHYGKNIKPGDIAVLSSAFVQGSGYLLHSFSVNGISVTINKVSKDMLDSELNAGRPVIAGLYSGPDHFIVITGKSGNDYIMHDPFLENGSSRLLSEKYSFSDITSLRLVQFN